ncbi:uncharacterized protein Dana_GF14908 [Drosophila ananassae]|uniref:F-box domain-containing protein n=1 Tax=Drosophila ananassae TaxID=7217 RepID=B3MLB6_DROAN|nr:uncharacterized protein Dana_GF14908 [Drosophila ananassae]
MNSPPINSSSSSAKKRKLQLVLNTHCFERIFSFLSLKDQLSFSRSHREVERGFWNYAQLKYKHLSEAITTELSESDLQYLVEQVNEHVLSYEAPLGPSARGEEQLWLLSRHCPMLRRLTMTFRRPRWGDLCQLKNLNTLHAFLNFDSPAVYEQFFSELSLNLPCLRKLVLEAPGYSGKGLHLLEKLEHLEVGARPGFKAHYLTVCCIKMKNLRCLEIGRNMYNLYNENFSAIVQNCRELERFVFGDRFLEANVAYERICELPNLKHVMVVGAELKRLAFIDGLVHRSGSPLESLILVGSELFREQVAHICDIASLRELWIGYQDANASVEAFLKLKSIEYLHLDMPWITNKQLVALLLGCPRLRVLNVLCCPFVTSEVISLLNSSLKKLRESNRARIEVYLENSAVDWNGGSNFQLESTNYQPGEQAEEDTVPGGAQKSSRSPGLSGERRKRQRLHT